MSATKASAVISPMCALLGGIVGQEVLKQLLYFDAFECLPVLDNNDYSEYKAQNSRYDDNIAVFGQTYDPNQSVLFRKKDIGKGKSVCAAQAVSIMNSDINIVAHQNRVGKDSESAYNFHFYDDKVKNGDNVLGPKYVRKFHAFSVFLISLTVTRRRGRNNGHKSLWNN